MVHVDLIFNFSVKIILIYDKNLIHTLFFFVRHLASLRTGNTSCLRKYKNHRGVPYIVLQLMRLIGCCGK